MHYFHYGESEALWGVPIAQALALRAWTMENHPFGGLQLSSPGYIVQESRKYEHA
jgi:hypothetical protein